MVKITDTVEIHDGVALMIGRHDSARGPNIDAIGGMYAYAMGKFAPEYFKIDPPEHIYHSPIARARNTAKMHCIAQGVTTGRFPEISYDDRFHEQSRFYGQAAEDAIKEAQVYGLKTIEIITHSNTPLAIADYLGAKTHGSLGYGGMVVLKADNWEDMRNPAKMKQFEIIESSKDLTAKVLGQTQTDILDFMINPSRKIEDTAMGQNPEIQKIGQDARVCFDWYGGEASWAENDKVMKVIINAKQEETKEWALKALKGEEVESVVRPDEFLEIYDAYKFWVENMMLSISMAATSPDHPLHSELMEKLVPFTARNLVEKLSENDESELHPIFNAYADKIEGKKFSARKAEILAKSQSMGLFVPGYTDVMEPQNFSPDHKGDEKETNHPDDDHPLLYALLAAKMRRDGGKK